VADVVVDLVIADLGFTDIVDLDFVIADFTDFVIADFTGLVKSLLGLVVADLVFTGSGIIAGLGIIIAGLGIIIAGLGIIAGSGITSARYFNTSMIASDFLLYNGSSLVEFVQTK
jgi:hypothetical protein